MATGVQFKERLKAGFGTSQDLARQQQIEKDLGLKGKFDIGDLADIAGGALPFIGSIIGAMGGTILGTPVGGVAGAGIGASAGEGLRQTIGHAIGARQETESTGEALRAPVVGLTTAAGFKAGSIIGNKVLLPIKNAVTKKFPEKLMAQIFKRSKDDFETLMKTETWQNIQQTNPQLFNKLRDQGIVRVGSSGQVEVNPTLAQEVLERGVWGSDESMFKYTFTKMVQLESALRTSLGSMKQRLTLPVSKKAYINLLNDITTQFKAQGRGFFSERVADARTLIAKLKKVPGNKVDPLDALELRRFLDSMRNTGSFRLNTNLSPKQEAFKVAADKLRGELATIPEIKASMNEYRIWIEAMDSIIDDAVKRGNTKLLNFTDLVLGGGGMASGYPGTGFGMAAFIRAFQAPWALTGTAQGLNRFSQKSLPESIKSGAKFQTGEGIKNVIGNILE